MMLFYIEQKVRIKIFEKRPVHWNPKGDMDKHMGEKVTISYFLDNGRYFVKENVWCWRDSDFENSDILEDKLFDI